jgi:hypothetical protein
MSRNLVVHYRRVSYLVQPTPEALRLGGRKVKVCVHEWQDGRVEIRHEGVTLPYISIDKAPHVSAGDVVENKRLGAVLTAIQAGQQKRDAARLASPKLRVAEKERLSARRKSLLLPEAVPTHKPRGRRPKRPDRVTLAGVDPNGPVQKFLDQFAAEQVARERKRNQVINDRKRAREFAAATLRAVGPESGPLGSQ